MNPRAEPPGRRASCIRCKEARERGTPITHPTRDVFRCGRCGYMNVAAGTPQTLPIPQSLGIAGLQSLRQRVLDASDADGRAVFSDIVAALADRARALVDSAPAYALANVARAFWIAESELAKHGGRPQGNDLARSGYAKAAALLCVLGARHGVPDLDAPERAPATPAEHAFQDSYWPVATDAAASGSILHRLLRGDVDVRIRGGSLVVTPTELGLDTDEMLLDRRDATANDRYQAEQVRSMWRALRLRRGVDLKPLIQSVLDPAGKPLEGIVTVPQDALSQVLRTTLDAFALTLDRVRTFHDAWFLDLGPRRLTAVDDSAVALSLVTRNWSAYYPVSVATRNGRAIYMLGSQGVAVMLDNLTTSKNRLLQELTERIPNDVPPDTREELRRMRVTLNRHAESRAQEILAEAGWRATAGEDWNLGGAKEEVDVLAARAHASCIDVLVGEVKDFDFTLHRISGASGLAARIRDAEAQLGRKHEGAAQSVADVLQRLGVHAGGVPVHVHALLITSEAPPPGMFSTVDGADFAALARFSQLLDNDRDLASRLYGRATRTVS